MSPTRFRINHRSLFITYGAFILLWIVVGLLFRISSLQSGEAGHNDRLLPVESASDPASTLEMGVFVDNVYLFQAENKTFDANGWIWLKWSETVQKQLDKKQLAPEKLIVFANQIDDWDFALKPTDEGILRLADGRYYQRFRFSGHFYVDHIDFHLYPFQTIRIPMIFEVGDLHSALSDAPLSLSIDREHSGVGAYIDIMGYETKGYQLRSLVHEYGTSMGNPIAVGKTSRVPQTRIEINYRKSANTSFLKLLLPLLTVMTLTLFSPSLSSSAWDVRVGIPPTALLTMIFLQQAYQEKLPELPYVSFLDTVYNVCYIVNIVLFGLFLWSSNEIQDASEQDKPALCARIEKIDHRFQIGLSVFLFLAIMANWLVLSMRHG